MIYTKYSTIRKTLMVFSIAIAGSVVSGCGGSSNVTNAVSTDVTGNVADPLIGAANENVTETDATPTVGVANCDELDGIGDIAAIAGLYDMSEEGDTTYTQIHSSGKVTVYDYQQDEVAQGNNCYLIHDGHAAISPLANDRYFELSYTDLDFSCQTETNVLTMTSNQNELTISYTDSNDEDGDGDFYDTFSKTHSVLSNLSVEAFNLCE